MIIEKNKSILLIGGNNNDFCIQEINKNFKEFSKSKIEFDDKFKLIILDINL